jgi:hypothetical protein
VATETEALAGLEADLPDADAVALRDQTLADAAVRRFLLTLELGGDLCRPGRLGGGDRRLVQHGQGHGIPPSKFGTMIQQLPRAGKPRLD